jgi:trk system potassium uptake protein TrkA
MLQDLQIPSECVIAAIIRKGRLIIPHGDTVLEPADEVLAVVHASQVSQFAAVLALRST